MFFVGPVLLIFLVFCVVLLCVLTFWFLCCDVRYDFCTKTMFGSSLHPVVCRRTRVLFTLFVFVCVEWCLTHIVLCFCNVFLRMLPVSLNCPFLIALRYSLTLFDRKGHPRPNVWCTEALNINLFWYYMWSVPDLDIERTYAIPLVRSLPIPHLHDWRKMEVCLIHPSCYNLVGLLSICNSQYQCL